MTADQPNIALISWDSVRADHLPVYGYDRMTTPTLADWASRGLVFDDVHVSGVGTPTSFSGAFTGEHAHGVQTNITPAHWREANAERRLLSEALQDAGYHTGAVHANALMSRYYGWDRGWDVHKDSLWTEAGDSERERRWNRIKKTTILPALRQAGVAGTAIHIRNIALKRASYANWESLWPDIKSFVSDAPEPWFLWVLLVDTHHPWFPPETYRRWDQPGFRKTHALNYAMRRWPDRVGVRNPKIVNAYDNELRHADAFLARFERLLRRTGSEGVPVIVHSDHGDELGEHGDYGHAPAMWDTVTRVPLIMWNVGEVGRVSGPHTLLDLGSTVLQLAGADERLGGRPGLLGDERVDREHVFVENRTVDGDARRAVVAADGWKAVHIPDGTKRHHREAYHRPTDPREQVDRVEEVPVEHLDALDQFEQDRTGSRVLESDADEPLSPEAHDRLAELGYL